MQDERFEDAPEDPNGTIYDAVDAVVRIDDPDLAWSESEDEIGDDFDSADERELDTQDGGADDEDWELAERGAVQAREHTVHFLPLRPATTT